MKDLTMNKALGTIESLTAFAEHKMSKEPAGTTSTEIFINQADIDALNTILNWFDEKKGETLVLDELASYAEHMMKKEPAGITCTEILINRTDINNLNGLLDYCAECEEEMEGV